jgi:hypothetical protein
MNRYYMIATLEAIVNLPLIISLLAGGRRRVLFHGPISCPEYLLSGVQSAVHIYIEPKPF